jgi:hypothetical protein
MNRHRIRWDEQQDHCRQDGPTLALVAHHRAEDVVKGAGIRTMASISWKLVQADGFSYACAEFALKNRYRDRRLIGEAGF